MTNQSPCQIETTKHARALRGSPTLSINQVACQLVKEGKKIYNFGIGEMSPQIPVPQIIKEAITAALEDNHTCYSPPHGDDELLQAISEDMKLNWRLSYEKNQIVVCPGPKDAVTKAFGALLSPYEPRNKVLTWAPIYESYVNMPYFFGGEAVIMNTEDDFLPDLKQLKEYLEEHHETVSAIIINSPNNPTGVVYPENTIKRLAEIIGQYPKIAILSDEVYRTIVFDGHKHISIAEYLPHQTLVFGGMSKEVAGTGLRLGFICGPKPVIDVITNVHANFTACVHLPTQKAYAKFLKIDRDLKLRYAIREDINSRKTALMNKVNALPGFKECVYPYPQGAFYLFANVSKLLGRRSPLDGKIINTDEELALYLLHSANVVTIPGSKLEKPNHIRLAFACCSVETIEKGCELLSEALMKLEKV